MYDQQDVGCLRCEMWDAGYLLECGMLVYKMLSLDIRTK